MRDAIDESISRNTMGLDDMMLKKMLLAYNTGKYSINTDVIIELTDEEGIACKNDSSISNPFSLKQGKDLEQIDINIFETAANRVSTFFDTLFSGGNIFSSEVYKKGKDEREGKQNKYYLHAKGILKFVNEANEELIYYDMEAMNKLYEEYEDKKDWENRDYAESIWNYLSSKAYTDGEKGVQMYSHEVINEEVIDWTFNDTDWYTTKINKQLISNYSKSRTIQDIDYYSLVSKYATPVEFMIDLLNISSSREFVNSFIDKVTNQTSITLKIYKTRLSSGTEITEDIEETTTVKGEAKVTATITAVDYDGDAVGYKEETAGIRKRVTLSGDNTLFGAVETTKVEVYLYNIPDNVQAVEVKLKFAEDGSTRYIYAPGGLSDVANIVTDMLGSSTTIEYEAWFPRYKTKSNTGTINRVTTELTTETKLDIAVEKAETWYATMTYDNYVQDNTVWESINSSGQRVRVYSSDPIMVSKTKSDEVYTSSSSNFSEIIDTSKSVDTITISEIAGRVENWYANLTSDNVFYWGLGGPLTHNIYEWLDGDRGRSLATENELLNIRFIYAMEEGIGDAFTKKTYTPIEVRYTATSYKIGYLYTNINNQLIQDTTPTVVSNYGFFLSLLKNNTGKYDRNATYNANGKDVLYKTVYGSEDRVGKLFEKSAEMLFSLLDSSPYTEGLTSVMKYIMYEYTTRNYGVTEFTYDIIPKEEFEWV